MGMCVCLWGRWPFESQADLSLIELQFVFFVCVIPQGFIIQTKIQLCFYSDNFTCLQAGKHVWLCLCNDGSYDIVVLFMCKITVGMMDYKWKNTSGFLVSASLFGQTVQRWCNQSLMFCCVLYLDWFNIHSFSVRFFLDVYVYVYCPIVVIWAVPSY